MTLDRGEGQATASGRNFRRSLIGREQAWTRLNDLLEEVWSGHCQVVVLSGAVGMGKSFLATALCQRWQERGGKTSRGQAQERAHQQPYFAWSALLRQLWDLPNAAAGPSRLEQLVTAVDPELLPRLPLLGDVLGWSLPDNKLIRSFNARLRQASTQALVLDLLRPHQDPLLLILEDAHWLDGPSWELLLAVVRGLSRRPLLICLTVRSRELSPAALAYLVELPAYEELALAELEPRESQALAQDFLGVTQLPAGLEDLVQHLGQGNPFFIEELLRALHEGGFLVVQGETVRIERPLAEAGLPETIQDIVLNRLDRLDPATRQTLQVAAVVGLDFSLALLQAIHPSLSEQEQVLRHQLDQLWDMDLIQRQVAQPDPVYCFRQSTTHQVTYEMLPLDQCQSLHRAVARYYETHFQKQLGPHYALLTYHYGRAGDRDRQVYYGQLAGHEAARRYAVAEALSFYDQVLTLLEQRAQLLSPETLDENRLHRWDLLKRREELYNLVGRREEQRSDVAALHALAQEIEQPEYAIEALLREAEFDYRVSDYDHGEQILQQVCRLAQENKVPLLEGRAWRLWGWIVASRGHYAEALQHYQRAMALFQVTGEEREQADTLNPLGVAYYGLCEYVQALLYLREGLQIYRQNGDHYDEMRALNYIGLVHWDCGQYDQALSQFEAALRMAHRIGSRYYETLLLGNIGDLYHYMSRFEQARVYLQQAIHLADEVNSPSLKGEFLNNLGRVFLQQEDFDQAHEYLQQARQIREALGEPAQVVLDLSFLALTCLGQGEVDRALAASQQALALLESKDVVVDWVQQIHYNHCRVCQAAGRQQEAAAALERAHRAMLDLAKEMSEEARDAFLQVRVNREIQDHWRRHNR